MFTIFFTFGTFILWLIVVIVQKCSIEDSFYKGRSKSFRKKAKKEKTGYENLTLSYILKENCNAFIKLNVFVYWFCIPYGVILPVTSALIDLNVITSEMFRYLNLPFLLIGCIIIIFAWVSRFAERYK